MMNLVKRCELWAEGLIATKDGVYKSPFAVQQATQAKLGEWAVYRYLVSIRECPIAPPVMEVLSHPNWDADLQTRAHKVAVKTCPSWNMNKIYKHCWTFQHSPTRSDPILKVKSDCYLVYFVQAKTPTLYQVYGYATTKDLCQSGAYIFEDGIDSPRLKGNKLFVKAHRTNAIRRVGFTLDTYREA